VRLVIFSDFFKKTRSRSRDLDLVECSGSVATVAVGIARESSQWASCQRGCSREGEVVTGEEVVVGGGGRRRNGCQSGRDRVRRRKVEEGLRREGDDGPPDVEGEEEEGRRYKSVRGGRKHS
jgi:hypothetical protein